jgi:site-specific recombinase XerD
MNEDRALLPLTSNTYSISSYTPAASYRPTLDQMVGAWLDAKGKISRGSYNTRYNYERIMIDFRTMLAQAGIDLDADPGLIATIAQKWAAQPIFSPWEQPHPSRHHAMGRHSALARAERLEREGGVSVGTYNNRLYCLSSFYTYSLKRGWFPTNPINLVEKHKGGERDYAHPLEKEEVEQALTRIDRSDLVGLRDYALLSLAFTTGRRASELVTLVWGDITFAHSGKATVFWRYCKGGKTMEDELTPGVCDAILDYMHARYGRELSTVPPEAPLWLVHARNEYRGHRLLQGGLSGIWKRRLGTSKVHTSRHTFAFLMEAHGAKMSDISHRLGHSNIATTSIYLQRMHRAENPYAQKLEQAIGISKREVPVEAQHDRLPDKAERAKRAIAEHPEMNNSELARLANVDRATIRMWKRKLQDKVREE